MIEAGGELEPFLDDGDQHVDRNCDPDLRLDSILGRAEERLDPQVLLDPDLTAFLYQRDRDYCIGMISSRWLAEGANVCGAGGLYPRAEYGLIVL